MRTLRWSNTAVNHKSAETAENGLAASDNIHKFNGYKSCVHIMYTG